MTWLNRILLALLVAGAVAWLPAHLSEAAAPEDLARVLAERSALEASNVALREEIALLEAEVATLHADPTRPGSRDAADAEVERIAREDLNLVRAGEVVFEVASPEAQ